MFAKAKQLLSQKRSFVIFFAILLSFAAVRIGLIFFLGDTAYGYDAGIYRRIFYDCSSGALTPGSPGSLLCPITNVLQSIGLSLDSIVFGVYVAFELLAIVLIYELFAYKLRTSWALFGTALFTSATFTHIFFTEYFFRNSIALLLLLIALRFFHKPLIVGITSFFLILIHPISILPLALTALILFCTKRKTYQWQFLTGAMGIIFGMLIAKGELQWYVREFLQQYIYPTVLSSARSAEFSGTFFSLAKSFFVYVPLLLLIFYGIKYFYKTYPVLSAWTVSCLFLSIPFIPFAERHTLYLSISLIFFAALGAKHLYDKKELSPAILSIMCISWVFICTN